MNRRDFISTLPLSTIAIGTMSTEVGASVCKARTLQPDRITQYRQSKHGIFVHLVPGLTVSSHGEVCTDIDALADNFDIDQFVRTVSSFCPDYIAFTAWHFRCKPLYASKVNAKWRSGKSSARRDLVGDLLRAMKRVNIPVILYTHPRDGHDFDKRDMISTGWGASGAQTSTDPNPATFSFDRWNAYIAEMYRELMHRYGSELMGVYVDEGSGRGDSYRVVDYAMLRAIIKGPHNGNMPVMIHNYAGNTYTADVGNKEYCHSEEFADISGETWPAHGSLGVSAVVGSLWYATEATNAWSASFSPESLYRYTVIQASLNYGGGGVAWSAGPYSSGGSWETGVESLLTRAGQLLRRRHEAIRGTVPSLAYPTTEGAAFRDLEWGVACESANRREIFLHVLKPPSGRLLRIGKPKNGVSFLTATELLTGSELAFRTEGQSVDFELPVGQNWDQLDTVIKINIR